MIPAIENQADSLRSLCLNYGMQRLELFGSAATSSKLPENSDLDFLVEFQPIAYESYADTYFGLLEDLQHLFGRPVDLVVYSAIKNPYFLQSIERKKTLSMKLETKKFLYDIHRAAVLVRELRWTRGLRIISATP